MTADATIASIDPTALLALVTAALAGATVWLALEARADRRQRRQDHDRELLRAALLEQIDNCRVWASGIRQDKQIETRRTPPLVEELTAALNGVSLPAAAVPYLVWARADVREQATYHRSALTTDGLDPKVEPLRAQVLDRAQQIACILRCAAAALGYEDVARALPATQWEIVEHRGDRTLNSSIESQTGRRPAEPPGEAFSRCRSDVRDQLGAETLARKQAALAAVDTGRHC